MTAEQIIAELRPLGREPYKKVILKHGVVEPCFGVKIDELQKIRKRIKKDHALALALYATGIYDAQYLASLIADAARMTASEFQDWLAGAQSAPLTGAVASVAAESPLGWELALAWIEARDTRTATAGWKTLCGLVSLLPDEALDLPRLRLLLTRVGSSIHAESDDVRYAMNTFVIALGASVRALTELAVATAETIGRVTVDMGDTACRVPFAPDEIRKIEQRGAIGKKRKSSGC